MKNAIEVINLSKSYNLGHFVQRNFREEVAHKFSSFGRRLLGKSVDAEQTEKFWAVKDCSFSVKESDRLALIGRNGAGKSTILKLMSRVTNPTSGLIRIRGRLATLLEVGTGFHPDLTGRENIYLNGIILGMTREEVKKKFDQIVVFAEVERFLDTPVKRYSSGMYVRLAFSVAAYLEPDILIVDEVLAVGDAAFQNKCLGVIEEANVQQGRTVLFVSHNMSAVRTLCNRGILLENGQVRFDGEVDRAIDTYLSDYSEQLERVWDDSTSAPGNEEIRLLYAGVKNTAVSEKTSVIESDKPIKVTFILLNHSEKNLGIYLFLLTLDKVLIFQANTPQRKYSSGRFEISFTIPAGLLNDQMYCFNLHIMQAMSLIFAEDDILTFEIYHQSSETEEINYEKRSGLIRPVIESSIKKLN